jgi:hypothetical protein
MIPHNVLNTGYLPFNGPLSGKEADMTYRLNPYPGPEVLSLYVSLGGGNFPLWRGQGEDPMMLVYLLLPSLTLILFSTE